MTATTHRTFTVRRIVVAADSSAQGRAAIAAAANLGARLHAEIEGLFVEDIDLIHLAALPFGREVRLISGAAQSFDTQTLEVRLRAQAAEARRALKALAEQARVHSTFRVVRGRVATEVIAAAGEGDLLVLGLFSHATGSRTRPGSTAVAAAEGAPRSVLLLRPGKTITGKPLVAYDGSEGAEVAFDAAARLAASPEGALTVLLVSETPEAADRLQSTIVEEAKAYGVTPRFLRAPKLELDAMCRMTQEAGSDILVLSADSPVLADKAHGRLLEQVGCPILLVR